jgi:hypothetical protein
MKIKTKKFTQIIYPSVIDCVIDISPSPVVTFQASKFDFMTDQIIIDFESGARLYVRGIYDPKMPESVIAIEITDDEMDDNGFECYDPLALIVYIQLKKAIEDIGY